MRIRRTLPIVLAVVTVAAALTLAVQLRKSAPPEPARLLPGADAFFYADLSWLHKNGSKPFAPVAHDPEYEKFIQATGFEFERDLEAVAFAVHYPSAWPGGGTAGPAPEPRFSEVFVGKFDGQRLAAYLKQIATAVENYNSVNIFTIPIQGRTFRVATLSVDAVAASNQDDASVIRGMVDRSRRLASPFAGPAFLRRYFKDVQLASPVWVVAHIEPSSPFFGGWSSVLPHAADVVVSASYNPLHLPLKTGVLHLRAEAVTANSDDARGVTEKLNGFLSVFNNAETSVGSPGPDPDLKALFDSLQIRQDGNRAELHATIPVGIFRKLMESPGQPPVSAGPAAPGAAATPAKAH
jgi:hypothetical protein